MTTMNFESLSPTIVMDNGSCLMKCGFKGDIAPKFVFPSTVENEKTNESTHKSNRYPIENGVIKDWDGFEKLLHRTFYELMNVDPGEHPLMMTEAPMRYKKQREKLAEMIFETFNFPAFHLTGIPAVLTLYSSGKTIGLIVDCGGGVMNTTAVCYRCNLRSIRRSNISGIEVTKYLSRLISERVQDFRVPTVGTTFDGVIRQMKENFCFVSPDYNNYEIMGNHKSSISFFDRDFELPDGRNITIGGSERFKAPEILFTPSLLGPEYSKENGYLGIHEMVYDSIQHKNGPFARRELYRQITIAGGSTMFPGFEKRLKDEVTKLSPVKCPLVEVHAPKNRKYSVWIGGSVMSSMSSMLNMFISREEYDEAGPQFIHRRCVSM